MSVSSYLSHLFLSYFMASKFSSRGSRSRKSKYNAVRGTTSEHKAQNLVVTRVLRYAVTHNISDTAKTAITTPVWSSQITGSGEWSKLSSIYQQFRLVRVRTRFWGCNIVTANPHTPVCGVIGHDPTGDVTGSGSPFDYLTLPKADLWSGGASPTWRNCDFTDPQTVRKDLCDINTNSCSFGIWNSVDHIGVLLGQTYVTAQSPFAAAGVQPFGFSVTDYVIQFRMPQDVSIALVDRPLPVLSDFVHVEQEEKKVDPRPSTPVVKRSSSRPPVIPKV